MDTIDEHALGEPPDSPDDQPDDPPKPAFEQDLEPEDQGTAEAVAQQAE